MKPDEVYTDEEIAKMMESAKMWIYNDSKLSASYSLAAMSAMMAKAYGIHFGRW